MLSLLPRAASRTSCEIFIEQNFGPHMEQKCATFAPSAGKGSSLEGFARPRALGGGDRTRPRDSNRGLGEAMSPEGAARRPLAQAGAGGGGRYGHSPHLSHVP